MIIWLTVFSDAGKSTGARWLHADFKHTKQLLLIDGFTLSKILSRAHDIVGEMTSNRVRP